MLALTLDNFERIQMEMPSHGVVSLRRMSIGEFDYFRVAGRYISEETGQNTGIFNLLFNLAAAGIMSQNDKATFKGLCEEIDTIMQVPPPYANPGRFVSYFKVDAMDRACLILSPLMRLAEKYNEPYHVLLCNALPGEVVYEDGLQIVVEMPELPKMRRIILPDSE